MKVSDDCHDALVDLFFNYLPAMDELELTCLFNAVIRIIERECADALCFKGKLDPVQRVGE